MEIAEVYQTKQGTVVVGEVACERIDFNDAVRIVGELFEQDARVGGVERYGRSGVAQCGERVGMLLVADRVREQLPLLAGMKINLATRAS